eukprot:CAMPEP_0170143230 /NCGR_PEP_ID=MMETSP0033_2-20121228/9667_1 /TAXON_ID=195969 /ORGANISM="Dolichomastix tenuilepis, Strain CCMP3274" /LENGTH=406 /DNA_ID=CAMNT_0010379663 /DNA_START=13 /DNA_END=1233 /DNA_ORIENTATION=+
MFALQSTPVVAPSTALPRGRHTVSMSAHASAAASSNNNGRASLSKTAAVMPSVETSASPEATNSADWTSNVQIFEYTSAANPKMAAIPVFVHPPSLHQAGETRIIPFDLSEQLEVDYPATAPNLMASFVRINDGESIDTSCMATSQAFYVIRGSGTSNSEFGSVSWSEGDLFVLPVGKADGQGVTHTASEGNDFGGAALYWVHDQPLMEYLGVEPKVQRFDPTLYTKDRLLAEVETIAQNAGPKLNRLGVLLGNAACPQTKTLTHVLWSLLNSLPPQEVQRPHRHNSVALDMAVFAPPGKVYTLMGKDIDANGEIVDPIKVEWVSGGVFVTPPGWWHSHHNHSDERAWVLPMQDAGLYTQQRTLDIRFVDAEVDNLKEGRIRGSAFTTTDAEYDELKDIKYSDSSL